MWQIYICACPVSEIAFKKEGMSPVESVNLGMASMQFISGSAESNSSSAIISLHLALPTSNWGQYLLHTCGMHAIGGLLTWDHACTVRAVHTRQFRGHLARMHHMPRDHRH